MPTVFVLSAGQLLLLYCIVKLLVSMSCPECYSGSVHDGKPRGTITELHGLKTYVSEPTDGRASKATIVILPDAFGWDFVNNRLLADHYADKGAYKVYLPDLMLGASSRCFLLLFEV